MQTQTPSGIEVISCGVMSYASAWDLQLRCHASVRDGQHPGYLLLLEHAPVLTMGKNASKQYLLAKDEQLRAQGVEVFQSDRGGEVTAHMPGQLVVYPILPVQRLKISPKSYVQMLLDTIVATLAELGIDAHPDDDFPGVWVGPKKICAIGIRIKERVSLHGLALNVENDLSLFDSIIPCGIRDKGVCSLRSLGVGEEYATRAKVEDIYVRHFLRVFGVPKL